MDVHAALAAHGLCSSHNSGAAAALYIIAERIGLEPSIVPARSSGLDGSASWPRRAVSSDCAPPASASATIMTVTLA